ncbi:MAG: nucleotide exchange factor GrpE [Bacteroidota bacterium]
MAEDKDKKFNEEKDPAQTENVQSQAEQDEQEAAAGSQEPTMEEKYADLNDRFIRLYSEFDNYRKRTNKEKVDLIATAGSGILKDLIPVLDDFERAIANNENSDDANVLKEGFHLIYNKFKTTLESKGLKMMNAKGEAFDSELHEAIANIPAPEDALKGKVIEDVEKGYFLNEKVIRYAKVVVGQ